MERETFFADIILPLALPRILTYRVPFAMNEHLQIGQRVVVPIGKTKKYTGIIDAIHKNVPQQYEAKYIEEILDDKPLVLPTQLQLWKWIAEYYACTLGDVMNAALPGGLKLNSETKFVLYEEVYDSRTLTEMENELIELLKIRNGLSLDEISEGLQIKNPRKIIKALLDKRIIAAEDEIKEKYKPRTADLLSLHESIKEDKKLQALFSELEKRKSHKQVEVLMMFLQMSNYDSGESKEVDRLKLQQQTKATASIIQSMVNKKIFTTRTIEVGRLAAHLLASEKAKALSEAQQKALENVESAFEKNDVVLLDGVTSSGKTEVYIHLIEKAVAQNKQVLFLLPEIALTTQIIHRLRKHFGKRVGIYHSGYSDNERTEVWNNVLADNPGECDIILGARSSVFLPFHRLGLIIVDEEHEHSFKQYDPAPRYHARDTAIVLGKFFNAKTLLGSATPSIETYWNAEQNRFGLVELKERYGGVALPDIELSDLRYATKSKKLQGSLTQKLVDEIQHSLSKNEQIILFQNRRGYTPLWQCHSCGWIPQCTRCDVSLTYHKNIHQLKCHYCGFHSEPPEGCHACGSTDLKMIGFGTEKIEEDIQQLFPDVVVQRMDYDTTRNKNSYQKIIHEFESGKIQILVGTQMVTKGLDFDNVSLVGILNADKMMKFPDYRSLERSYQLMTQVAGRAGRREKTGKVVIQTYDPSHWLFGIIKTADYKSLYDREIAERKQFGYPPFLRLMRLTIKHKDEQVAMAAATSTAQKLKELYGPYILGPEKPMIPRINNNYLFQILIKLRRTQELSEHKKRIIEVMKEIQSTSDFKSIRVSVDVDPI